MPRRAESSQASSQLLTVLVLELRPTRVWVVRHRQDLAFSVQKCVCFFAYFTAPNRYPLRNKYMYDDVISSHAQPRLQTSERSYLSKRIAWPNVQRHLLHPSLRWHRQSRRRQRRAPLIIINYATHECPVSSRPPTSMQTGYIQVHVQGDYPVTLTLRN